MQSVCLGFCLVPTSFMNFKWQTLWRLYRDITIVERHSSCSGSAEPPQSSSSQSSSSSSSSGSYSQSEEEDQELGQYQEALYNLEQQRDAVRPRSPPLCHQLARARGKLALIKSFSLTTPNLGTAHAFSLFCMLDSQTSYINPKLCGVSCIGHARKPSI